MKRRPLNPYLCDSDWDYYESQEPVAEYDDCGAAEADADDPPHDEALEWGGMDK
jgi:hypothetical protein